MYNNDNQNSASQNQPNGNQSSNQQGSSRDNGNLAASILKCLIQHAERRK